MDLQACVSYEYALIFLFLFFRRTNMYIQHLWHICGYSQSKETLVYRMCLEYHPGEGAGRKPRVRCNISIRYYSHAMI